jgi:hypothetical protein
VFERNGVLVFAMHADPVPLTTRAAARFAPACRLVDPSSRAQERGHH